MCLYCVQKRRKVEGGRRERGEEMMGEREATMLSREVFFVVVFWFFLVEKP